MYIVSGAQSCVGIYRNSVLPAEGLAENMSITQEEAREITDELVQHIYVSSIV